MTSEDTPSGLEFLRSIIDGRTPRAPISNTLGFDLVAVEEGSAVFEGRPGAHLCNPMGTVHGGYLSTLLDSALGSAVLSRLPAGAAYTTAQLNVNLIRPVTPDTGTLRATAAAIHVGRPPGLPPGGAPRGTAEAQLTGIDDGKLYAHATATCAVLS